MSGAGEGALIAGAALSIAVEAMRRLFVGSELGHLGSGMAISAVAGGGNLVLGLYLLRAGRRESSEALRADAVHVLFDTLTTAASLPGPVAVTPPRVRVIGPILPIPVARNPPWAGARAVRRS